MVTVVAVLSVMCALMGVIWAWWGIRAITTDEHRAGIAGVLTITTKGTGVVVLTAGVSILAFCLFILRSAL